MERSIRQERPDVNPERGMGFQPMDDPQTRRPNLAPPSSHVAWASSQ